MNEPAPTTAADSRRSSFWLLIVMALFVLAAGLGLRDPWPPGEPAFALAAKQMAQSGEWLFPHRGRELFTNAPPLLVWLEVISYKVTDSWRAAFLLPSLLAGLLTLGTVYGLGRRLWTRRIGLYAAVAVLFAFQFTSEFKRGQVDSLATCFVTLANWGLLVHCLRGPNWRAFWIGCFAAALGVLTKGASVLVVLMLVPYIVARWQQRADVTTTEGSLVKWLAGLALFVLPIAIWMISVSVAAKAHASADYAAYLHATLFDTGSDPGQTVWYFVPTVLAEWMPLPIIFLATSPGWFSDLRSGDARVVFPMAWSLATVAILSALSNRHDSALLIALPMFVIAIAPHLPAFAADRWARLFGFFAALIGGFAFTGIGAWSLLNHVPSAEKFIEEHGLSDLNWIVWVMVVAMGCAMLLSAMIFRLRRGVSSLLGAVAGVWLIWSLWAYPMLNDSTSAATLMRRARDLAGRDAEIGLVAWKEQNLLMLAGPSRDFGFNWPRNLQFQEAVDWQAQAPQKRYVFILDDAMGACIDTSRAMHVGHANHREWWMFKSDAVVAGCTPSAGADD